MKLLINFCVSQPIPLLSMTTEDKFVSNTHILFSEILVYILLTQSLKSYQYPDRVQVQSALLTLTVCNFLPVNLSASLS